MGVGGRHISCCFETFAYAGPPKFRTETEDSRGKMSAKDVFQLIKDKDVKFVDLRFTDTWGKEQHVSVPVSRSARTSLTRDTFLMDRPSPAGKGSRRPTWYCCRDPTSCFIDPFLQQTTLAITVIQLPIRWQRLRSRSAVDRLKRGRGDPQSTASAAPRSSDRNPSSSSSMPSEWNVGMQGSSFKIFSEEGAWKSNRPNFFLPVTKQTAGDQRVVISRSSCDFLHRYSL